MTPGCSTRPAASLSCLRRFRPSLPKRLPATIGIGGGNATDGQILVWADAMGMTEGFKPKFLRHFAHLGQALTDGVGDYVRAVKDGSFPNGEESY